MYAHSKDNFLPFKTCNPNTGRTPEFVNSEFVHFKFDGQMQQRFINKISSLFSSVSHRHPNFSFNASFKRTHPPLTLCPPIFDASLCLFTGQKVSETSSSVSCNIMSPLNETATGVFEKHPKISPSTTPPNLSLGSLSSEDSPSHLSVPVAVRLLTI